MAIDIFRRCGGTVQHVSTAFPLQVSQLFGKTIECKQRPLIPKIMLMYHLTFVDIVEAR